MTHSGGWRSPHHAWIVRLWVIPPGLDAWVVGDEAVVTLDFSPTAASYGSKPESGLWSLRSERSRGSP